MKQILLILSFSILSLVLWLRSANKLPFVTDPLSGPKFINQQIIFSGRLVKVIDNGSALYLDFGTPHQRTGILRGRIWKKDWQNFSSSPSGLMKAGDKVKISGLVEWYQADTIIDIKGPSQIEVLANE